MQFHASPIPTPIQQKIAQISKILRTLKNAISQLIVNKHNLTLTVESVIIDDNTKPMQFHKPKFTYLSISNMGDINMPFISVSLRA